MHIRKAGGIHPKILKGVFGALRRKQRNSKADSRGREPFAARQSSGGWSYFYCYCLSTNLPVPNDDVVQSELFAINDS